MTSHAGPPQPDAFKPCSDLCTQLAVMTSLFDLPVQVTVDELVTELAANPQSFSERDAILRAVGDLRGAGLLHPLATEAQLVLPTRAAFHAFELFEQI